MKKSWITRQVQWNLDQQAKTNRRCKNCGQRLSMRDGQIWHTASTFVFCQYNATKAELDENEW